VSSHSLSQHDHEALLTAVAYKRFLLVGMISAPCCL